MHIFNIKKGIYKTEINAFGLKLKIKNKQDFITQTHNNYTKVLNQIRQKFGQSKIKVGFLVCEQSKWQYQSLYDELSQSPYFEPVVLVTEMSPRHHGKKSHYNSIEECFNFFASRNLNPQYAYDIKAKKYIPINNFGIDILFYQQPWMIDDTQHPIVVSQNALTCYITYGVNLTTHSESYHPKFHSLIWKIFIENETLIDMYEQFVNQPVNNCVVTGYPKLDIYFQYQNKPLNLDKKTIIYAPHHSFSKDSLGCATFDKNGKEILELAKKYQHEINWIFKPHPSFKNSVINFNIMTETEIDQYFKEWENIGTIYQGGAYFDMFHQSSALITDCISFLGEYLPSKHPLFHLIGPKQPFNQFAESFLSSFYKIHNFNELEQTFEEVILKDNDFKKEQRLEKIKIMFDENEQASSKIIKHITQELKAN